MAKRNSDPEMDVLLCRDYERYKRDFVLRNIRQQIHFTAAEEFLATDPEARVRFPALPEKKM
jgi:hypothetical protein